MTTTTPHLPAAGPGRPPKDRATRRGRPPRRSWRKQIRRDWQVYSLADVVLALLAIVLVAVAMLGTRSIRVAATAAAAVALGFTFHALSAPPTKGANIFRPAYSVPQYASPGASAGAGETIAIVGLLLALGGLALSFTAD